MSKRTDRRRQIERLLARRASEGLSLRALSERSGIPVGTLSWWTHRLRQDAPPAFAEVQLTDLAHGTSTIQVDAPEIIVRHPDGVAVELRGVAAERVVAHVLTRIERWS